MKQKLDHLVSLLVRFVLRYS